MTKYTNNEKLLMMSCLAIIFLTVIWFVLEMTSLPSEEQDNNFDGYPPIYSNNYSINSENFTINNLEIENVYIKITPNNSKFFLLRCEDSVLRFDNTSIWCENED